MKRVAVKQAARFGGASASSLWIDLFGRRVKLAVCPLDCAGGPFESVLRCNGGWIAQAVAERSRVWGEAISLPEIGRKAMAVVVAEFDQQGDVVRKREVLALPCEDSL